MYKRVFSGCLIGIEACCIEVEVDCSNGIGQIQIVGLPGVSIREAQDRVRSSIRSCALLMPPGKKWTINLAPADLRKEGPAYDLPIAIGILASTEMMAHHNLEKFWFIGELGLDGSIRAVPGILPLALACRQNYGSYFVVPQACAEEAAYVEDIEVFGVSHLTQVIALLNDINTIKPIKKYNRSQFLVNQQISSDEPDLSEVKGQQFAKRGLEIAAAGHHNILFVGPPGSGKSMLAQRLPSIMPPLSFEEAIELTKLYSVAGLITDKGKLMVNRPLRTPHHSASGAGLIGGGSRPKPGEISLAHMGILFLDELTEFSRANLDTLRQPLETNNIIITRANQTLNYPACFLLVAACNPCPCGFRGDPIHYCNCSSSQAYKYWSRLSGPFLDRIDLHINVPRLASNELASDEVAEASSVVRQRVLKALENQKQRLQFNSFLYNSQLTPKLMKEHCKIDSASQLLLAKAVSALGLSARSFDRIIRVSRTIADLEDSIDIKYNHIAEALSFRNLH